MRVLSRVSMHAHRAALQLRAGMPPSKIVSGGQTGVDRAALDAALALGVTIGGWIPRGRWAEDGPVPEELAGLRETESAEPSERTRRNVADSDGTLVLSHGPLVGGSALTVEVAAASGRPHLCLDLDSLSLEEAAERARRWIIEHGVQVLNVAGPRASEDPRAYADTRALLSKLLTNP
jgi:predicted Rossmann fold nucleotide-binding protein DprA/Smf involved in DNA uptake